MPIIYIYIHYYILDIYEHTTTYIESGSNLRYSAEFEKQTDMHEILRHTKMGRISFKQVRSAQNKYVIPILVNYVKIKSFWGDENFFF